MQTNTKDQVYAGFFVRLTAFLVDMIIVNAALLVIRIPMWILSLNSPDNVLVRDFIFQYSITDIVCYLLTVLIQGQPLVKSFFSFGSSVRKTGK